MKSLASPGSHLLKITVRILETMKPPHDLTVQSPTLKLLDALIVLSPYISKIMMRPLEVIDLAKTFLKNLWPLGASMVRSRGKGSALNFDY